MLAELQARHPLKAGMKVCDPSSGSGAFLVQAYRRLIENTFDTTKPVKASELKQLLQASIFGVDLDGDACRVTELSLLLTLLDYVDPPDLTGKNSTFKLPSLHNQNIFEGNFFMPDFVPSGRLKWKPFFRILRGLNQRFPGKEVPLKGQLGRYFSSQVYAVKQLSNHSSHQTFIRFSGV